MKTVCTVAFFIGIMAFGLSRASSVILAEQTKPVYSITISMNEREIYGSQKVNVSFTILGTGDISFGQVVIYSDTDNILYNTYWLQCYIVKGVEFLYYDQFGPAGGEEIKTTSGGMPIPSLEVPAGAYVWMHGEFGIDTNGTALGSHRLRVVFLAQVDGENCIFEDSIEYRMISFLESIPILQYLIPAGISFLTTIIVLMITEYVRYRKEKRRHKTQESSVDPQSS